MLLPTTLHNKIIIIYFNLWPQQKIEMFCLIQKTNAIKEPNMDHIWTLSSHLGWSLVFPLLILLVLWFAKCKIRQWPFLVATYCFCSHPPPHHTVTQFNQKERFQWKQRKDACTVPSALSAYEMRVQKCDIPVMKTCFFLTAERLQGLVWLPEERSMHCALLYWYRHKHRAVSGSRTLLLPPPSADATIGPLESLRRT